MQMKSIYKNWITFHTFRIPESCKICVTKISAKTWYNLQALSKWIFVLLKPLTVTLNCENLYKQLYIQFSNIGIFTINNFCKLYTPTAILITQNDINSKYESQYQAYLPHLDIIQDDCVIETEEKYMIHSIDSH